MQHGAGIHCRSAYVRLFFHSYFPRTKRNECISLSKTKLSNHIFQNTITSCVTLSVSHCLTPPTPPTQNNLTLQDWDATSSMSDWTAKINYTCNAGGHNAFVSDRWKDFYELTCQEDNSFSTPTWPTCVSSKIYENNL